MVLFFWSPDGKHCRARINATFSDVPRVSVTGSNKGKRRDRLAHILPGALVAEYNGNATWVDALPPDLPPELA